MVKEGKERKDDLPFAMFDALAYFLHKNCHNASVWLNMGNKSPTGLGACMHIIPRGLETRGGGH